MMEEMKTIVTCLCNELTQATTNMKCFKTVFNVCQFSLGGTKTCQYKMGVHFSVNNYCLPVVEVKSSFLHPSTLPAHHPKTAPCQF